MAITTAHPTRRTRASLADIATAHMARMPQTDYQRLVAAGERRKHEDAFYQHVALRLQLAGYPSVQAQYRGLIPGRRFVYDFAWIEAKLLVEMQGQIWHKGGHTSGYGVTRDAVKLNEATALGWRVLFITPEMITSGEAYDYTERALRAAGYRTMVAPQTPRSRPHY